MSTPGTPLPDEVEYNSHIESPSTTYYAYDPYDNSEEISHTEPSERLSDTTLRTFLDYRNPQPTMSGGVTSSSTGTTSTATTGKSATYDTATGNMATGTKTTGHSGAVNQTAYSDPNSAEFRNRKLADTDSTNLTGADPSRRRRSSSAGKVANVGTSNDLVGNQKTGHDAVNDIAKNTGGMMGSRSWSEQPLVLAMIWVGIVGLIYAAWVFLGGLNPEGKRELLL